MYTFHYLSNVTTLKLETDRCNGCKICMVVCPHNVFGFSEKKVFIRDLDACMECGACTRNCPEQAIYVKSGVGCATAVINSKLKRKSECSCNSEETVCCG